MTTTAQPSLQFGISISPATRDFGDAMTHAKLADSLGLDLLTAMDHPYNRHLLDTMTLLTAVATTTERIHIGTNVANLPLRPPAMLAKQTATLDVISGGRFELGLGAGAAWDAIGALGGPRRTGKEAYRGFRDALHILKGFWSERSFSYEGEIYSVKGARPGPSPAHAIPIWVGASGPSMLRLTGRMADGVIVSNYYEGPDRLVEINNWIDEGAAKADRDPTEIRRGYNLMSTIDVGQGNLPADGIVGTPDYWIDTLTELAQDYRQDTFILWPNGPDAEGQITAFAEEVAPAVRAAVGASEKVSA